VAIAHVCHVLDRVFMDGLKKSQEEAVVEMAMESKLARLIHRTVDKAISNYFEELY
jgi:hypothetical protein